MSFCPNLPTSGWKRPIVLVERTVSRWQGGMWLSQGERLSDFRSARAYILLGEPGSGKSKAFEQEARIDKCAVGVTARRFIRGSIDAHPGVETGDSVHRRPG